ncbi:Uncharacterised protein [Mycobacteroides abscessus subsp. abscessus]|nr:Uncharacterised protein [Mycobacteroides abscessus subsp. abscessus]
MHQNRVCQVPRLARFGFQQGLHHSGERGGVDGLRAAAFGCPLLGCGLGSPSGVGDQNALVDRHVQRGGNQCSQLFCVGVPVGRTDLCQEAVESPWCAIGDGDARRDRVPVPDSQCVAVESAGCSFGCLQGVQVTLQQRADQGAAGDRPVVHVRRASAEMPQQRGLSSSAESVTSAHRGLTSHMSEHAVCITYPAPSFPFSRRELGAGDAPVLSDAQRGSTPCHRCPRHLSRRPACGCGLRGRSAAPVGL